MNYPKIASIEITNICNHKCNKCFHGYKPFNKEKKFMNLDFFKRVIKWLPDTVNYIGLSGIGEPLLHPQFMELIDICKKVRPDCLIGFHSNGTNLDDQMIDDILLRKNIDDINFSVDSISDYTYKIIHNTSQTDLNDLIIKIAKLKNKRDSSNSRLRITTSFVIQKENLKELLPFILSMRGLGIDDIGPINLVNPLPGYDINKWDTRLKDLETELEKIQQLVNMCNTNVKLPQLKGRRFGSANMEHIGEESCAFPFELYPIIDVCGNVFPCVWLQFNEKYKIGNIVNDSVEKIYYGDKIEYIREVFRKNKYFYDCKECNPGGLLSFKRFESIEV